MTLSEGRFSALPRAPTLSPSLRTPFRKTIDGADCSYFSGQKDTPIILLQLTAISCFSAITLEFANELETTALNSKGQKTVCSVLRERCCVCYCVKRETLLSTLLLLDG